MPAPLRRRKIVRAVTVVAAEEPISPELVLVSPPEVAQLARSVLQVPVWSPPRSERELGRVGLASLWLFCLATTAGPLFLMLAAAH